MDEGKILVVNLSKGLIGEDNAGILGAFLVTKVQLAAMSRSDIPDVKDRRPFYLYVDEFQNFATDSFAVILSEARKYGLNLTVANQYVAQMTDSVRDAVFGNVGTTISFRVSADDAPVLVKQFEPTFEESDLLQLNNRHFVISMIIGGEKVPAFSATTLSIPDSPSDNFEAIIEYSRANFARPRSEVEAEIRETIEQSEKYKKELSDSGRQEEVVFAPISRTTVKEAPTLPNNTTIIHTEQKPNLKRSVSLQAEFRKQNLSPNAAEGKERLGLKDLAKVVAEKEGNKAAEKSSPVPEKGKRRSEKKGKHKMGKKASEVRPSASPVVPVSTDRINPASAATPKINSVSSPVKLEVKPEVIYQEKDVVEIIPSKEALPLSTPVKRTDRFAEVDNSVDGFLAIKHDK